MQTGFSNCVYFERFGVFVFINTILISSYNKFKNTEKMVLRKFLFLLVAVLQLQTFIIGISVILKFSQSSYNSYAFAFFGKQFLVGTD